MVDRSSPSHLATRIQSVPFALAFRTLVSKHSTQRQQMPVGLASASNPHATTAYGVRTYCIFKLLVAGGCQVGSQVFATLEDTSTNIASPQLCVPETSLLSATSPLIMAQFKNRVQNHLSVQQS